MNQELFALGVAVGMEKAATRHAKGTMIPAAQTGKSTPTMTAKSGPGPANATADRKHGKTRQDQLDSRGVQIANENPNV